MTVGFGLAIGGLAVAAPALVGLVGRVAGRLPLSGRLAVRDAARHQHRTGPAVAAAMVAVTGSVAVLYVVASFDRHDRMQYQPAGPFGSVTVYSTGLTSEADLLASARQAAVELPGAAVVPMRYVTTKAGEGLDAGAPGSPPAACDPNLAQVASVTAGADLAAVLAGPQQAAARAALAGGKAAVFNSCLLTGGRLQLGSGTGHPITVPAVVVTSTPTYPSLPAVVLDDSTVRRLGLATGTSYALITTSRPPTAAEEDRARGAVDDTVQLVVERGFGSPYRLGILALVGIAGLITLAGVLISVALSAAEGQADLATLAAIGATPRRRRSMAAWQAALVAGLGALPGVALGTAMGQIVRLAMTGYPAVLPWPGLLALGVAVPATGVLLVAATTRARLVMVRRLA
jgi:putative ABC transport system permease protein